MKHISKIKFLSAILLTFVLLTFVACENPQFRSREKGALAGGALGAGLGAIVGNQVGSSGAGIAIGSAIGAVSGGLIGNSMDAQDDRANEVDSRLSAQEREIEENRRILQELKAGGLDVRTTDRGIVANLPDVLFQFNSARLTSGARNAISEIARVTSRLQDRHISVEGHADSIGTTEYNNKLSSERANSVADELVNQGVSPRKISSRGFGESKPIASNSTESGRAKNRRVEVVIEN